MAGKGVAVAIFLAVVFSTATLSRSATVAAPPSTSPARSPVAAPPHGIVPQLPSPAPGGSGGGSSSSDGPTIPSTLSPPNPDAVGSPTSSPAKSSSVTETFPRPTYITWGILCVVVFLLPEWLV